LLGSTKEHWTFGHNAKAGSLSEPADLATQCRNIGTLTEQFKFRRCEYWQVSKFCLQFGHLLFNLLKFRQS
jgi:hypothetical protein